MRVLITGATGFVAHTLIPELLKRGEEVRGAVRSASVESIECVRVGAIDSGTDWRAALKDVDAVIHLAARVHVMRDRVADPLEAFRRVNVDGTRRLAEQAAEVGVRRFIFLSSIKAMSEDGALENSSALTEALLIRPDSPYGQSKWEAEQTLFEISDRTGLDVVIFRPPLVYGPGVKGNFLSLLKLCRSGAPLPLGAINNRRSLVYIENLVDALICGLHHPKVSGERFLVCDGEALSTTALVRHLRSAMEQPARLFSVSPGLLRRAARCIGREAVWRRLAGSLEIDDRKFRTLTNWRPPFSAETGLQKTVSWFLTSETENRIEK
ncbi:UDP-glucose 4-epimerase [Azospirillaceae bacterium]